MFFFGFGPCVERPLPHDILGCYIMWMMLWYSLDLSLTLDQSPLYCPILACVLQHKSLKANGLWSEEAFSRSFSHHCSQREELRSDRPVFSICTIVFMDRTLAEPQVMLSLLRRNSYKIYSLNWPLRKSGQIVNDDNSLLFYFFLYCMLVIYNDLSTGNLHRCLHGTPYPLPTT